jgi:hypothetical protein
MTKGEIIESVLKELRSGRTVKRKRPSEDDEEEEAVVTHLEKLMQDAPPETNILTCADLSDLNVECCTQCHYFMFFYDMCSVVKLKSGEYAWLCCALKRVERGKISEKALPPEQSAKSAGYRPFADTASKQVSGRLVFEWDPARMVRISPGSAGGYLQRVLAKTGGRRQTELMRLMLSLPMHSISG